MSGERLNVFATRMTLTVMKNRSKGAKAGARLTFTQATQFKAT
jgi:vacuolar-type H+-ATPase subunit D/Vma8